jgi:putative CocE/NonD family hydrolase
MKKLFWRVAILGVIVALPLSAPGQAPKGKNPGPYEVAVQKNHQIPMRDGVKLGVDLYLPAKNGKPLDGKHPTLLCRTPYDKNLQAAEGRWFASHGYAVVLNDVRGRFASEGRWRMLLDDPYDGYDMVEWIATQPWSSGKVGTFGTSYVGGTQHALAIAAPPHLTCMIPVDSMSNIGIAGVRHSGAFELRWVNWTFNQGATNAKEALLNPALKKALEEQGALVSQHLLNLPVRKGTTPLKVVPDYEDWLVEALRHGDNDAYWKQPGYSVVDNIAKYADVPVYHVTGWYDSWCRQNVMNWQALSASKKSPQMLIIGPWTHGAQNVNFAGELEFPAEAALKFNEWRKLWFDRWLMGKDNGVEKEAPVKLFIMGGGDGSKSPSGRLKHGGHWREEKTFPLERTKFTPYYLHADGGLSPSKPAATTSSTTLRFDPFLPIPTIGGNLSSVQGLLEAGGFDQRTRKNTLYSYNQQLPLSERRDNIVFQTAPLTQDMEVTGPVTVHLYVSSSQTDTDFTAKLIDVYPSTRDYTLGFDLNIGDSIVRMRYRNSLEKAELMKPGQVYEATIHLYPTANVFAKGHRIRLDISSSNFPRFDLNPGTGEPLQEHRGMLKADNTVFHNATQASHVMLPVIAAGK